MATISFPIPSNLASFLSASGVANASADSSTLTLQVPSSASASGGGSAAALQVPALALPAPVVSGLTDAGYQVPQAVVDASASAAGSGGASVGLAQFAPAGLRPQGEALENPALAGANAAAQNLSEAANTFIQQAAANGGVVSSEQFASFVLQQNEAIQDYIFGA